MYCIRSLDRDTGLACVMDLDGGEPDQLTDMLTLPQSVRDDFYGISKINSAWLTLTDMISLLSMQLQVPLRWVNDVYVVVPINVSKDAYDMRKDFAYHRYSSDEIAINMSDSRNARSVALLCKRLGLIR